MTEIRIEPGTVPAGQIEVTLGLICHAGLHRVADNETTQPCAT